jgi:hypothetical protein
MADADAAEYADDRVSAAAGKPCDAVYSYSAMYGAAVAARAVGRRFFAVLAVV